MSEETVTDLTPPTDPDPTPLGQSLEAILNRVCIAITSLHTRLTALEKMHTNMLKGTRHR